MNGVEGSRDKQCHWDVEEFQQLIKKRTNKISLKLNKRAVWHMFIKLISNQFVCQKERAILAIKVRED